MVAATATILLSDQELTGTCHNLLVLSEGVDAARVPATMEGRWSWLEVGLGSKASSRVACGRLVRASIEGGH